MYPRGTGSQFFSTRLDIADVRSNQPPAEEVGFNGSWGDNVVA